MITQVKIPVSAPESVRILSEFAYNLYGAWMKLLSPEQADSIHEAHSMNQYLTPGGKNSAVLTVNLLNDETADCLMPIFQNTHDYFLTKYGFALTAGQPQSRSYEEDDLVKPFFISPQVQSQVRLHLMSPTTFRTNNRYAVFPTPELILHSASSRWDALGFRVSVDDEEAIRQIMERTVVTGYHLASSYYGLKGTRIQSFTGSITLSIRGPEPMVRLFDMLMNGLRFTGLGVKTSLGMGGIVI